MTATDRYNRFKIIVKKDGLSQIADSYYWQRLIIDRREESASDREFRSAPYYPWAKARSVSSLFVSKEAIRSGVTTIFTPLVTLNSPAA